MKFKHILYYFNIFLSFIKGIQSYRNVSHNYSCLIPHYRIKQMFINNTHNINVNDTNVNNYQCRFNLKLFNLTHYTDTANNPTNIITGSIEGPNRNLLENCKHKFKLCSFSYNEANTDTSNNNENSNKYDLLNNINSPDDLKRLSVDLLPKFCSEIRLYLGETISKTGGHFSGSLGVTELSVALHYVFNSPSDKIVWDIGHQAYVHKILTGRRERLATIRKKGGLSGFCRMYESEHDIFGAGHSSTSISFSQGLLEGNMLLNNLQSSSDMGNRADTMNENGILENWHYKNYSGASDGKVIAVIGDGSMTGGLAYESLNYAVSLKTPLIIIYNDNHQVSLPTGLSSATGYDPVLPFFLQKTTNQPPKPLDVALEEFYSSLSNKNDRDLNIIGPIDGHNVFELTQLFNLIKKPHSYIGTEPHNDDSSHTHTHPDNSLYVGNVRVNGPLLIHIKTVKGLGCQEALKSLDTLHSIKPNTKLTIVDPNVNNNCNIVDFNHSGYNSAINTTDSAHRVIDTTNSLNYYKNYIDYVNGKPVVKDEVFDSDNFSHVFARTLVKLAETDPKIVAVTAATPGGTGVGLFGSFYPQRTFDVGICEQHAITFSAGLSVAGLKPYVSIYSTFLQRGLDQLIHDVLLQGINLNLIIDRAGYVGEDGLSHHGNYDVNMLSLFKKLVLMFPSDQLELALMLKLSSELNGQTAIRYPKDKVPNRAELSYSDDFYNYVKHFRFLDSSKHDNIPNLDPAFSYTTSANTTNHFNSSLGHSYQDCSSGSNVGDDTAAEFNRYYSDLRSFKSRTIRQGERVAILCLGTVLHDVTKSLQIIGNQFSPTVIDMRFLNPLDLSVLEKLEDNHTHLIIVEEVISGGLGSAILEHLAEKNKLSQFKIKCIKSPYEFIHHATRQEQKELARLDAQGIASQIQDFITHTS